MKGQRGYASYFGGNPDAGVDTLTQLVLGVFEKVFETMSDRTNELEMGSALGIKVDSESVVANFSIKRS
ncbi:hypothetical protein PVK06_035361 [Gossypium arboreum]|uniref:Uncharacterized protein n=1 Tax=Gossypium arboreum TaxID=29729 RepID=A0ABR0NGL8_GOSAR|nr:hypothetical protein PVK06_035361 [Gossypium arboreum]